MGPLFWSGIGQCMVGWVARCIGLLGVVNVVAGVAGKGGYGLLLAIRMYLSSR